MPADALTVLNLCEVYDDYSDSSFSVAKNGKLDFINARTGNTFCFTMCVDTLDCLLYDLSRNSRSGTQPTSPHVAGALPLNSSQLFLNPHILLGVGESSGLRSSAQDSPISTEKSVHENLYAGSIGFDKLLKYCRNPQLKCQNLSFIHSSVLFV